MAQRWIALIIVRVEVALGFCAVFPDFVEGFQYFLIFRIGLLFTVCFRCFVIFSWSRFKMNLTYFVRPTQPRSVPELIWVTRALLCGTGHVH